MRLDAVWVLPPAILVRLAVQAALGVLRITTLVRLPSLRAKASPKASPRFR